jgi:ER-derived vesicles protein
MTVPWGITHVFLVINVIAMTINAVLIIIRKHSEYAVLGLVAVVIVQALGYGLIFDLNFFLRNVSVIGGLLMVLSDSWVRKKFAGAGLPQIDEKDKKMYVQLAGRVLLICLFLGFVIAGEWTVWRVIVSLLGFVSCIMVVVGFKAKFSATILVLLLSIFNILVNNWWTVSASLLWYARGPMALTARSYIPITRTRTLPNTTFSRFSPLCRWLFYVC